MGLLNKKLKAAVAATSPEGFGSIAASCKKSADKMRDAAALLDQAGEAYAAGDPVKGHNLFKNSEEAFTKK